MQYQVPQFIEIEDKIFGPLTLKQFIYLAGGGGLCLVFISFFPIYLTLLFSMPVILLSGALAFYQVNGRPFLIAIEHASGYLFSHKLYLWKQREAPKKSSLENTPTATVSLPVPTLSESRLRDLSWSLNIKDTVGSSEGSGRSQFEI